MNIIDKVLARIPFAEVTIKTTINSYAVIERIDYGVKPTLIHRRQRNQFFTFDGSYEGNYFKIQAHMRNPDGEDAFPSNGYVTIGFFRLPLNIETSPAFYGRVFDNGDEGAIIKGHFGIPFPTFGLLCALVMLTMGRIYPKWSDSSLVFSLFLITVSVMSLIEFATERKGILDFLKGLFYDVIEAK